ncbi:sensor histidine kinase [Tenacibaculum haliotis]|uniref:sensor histidine kinase n=1 Tax=Tenacibaculum haliotis TaxID=1888914 RepID=UPI0021B01BBA|nr:sensor histidine kinase [Tenacibaculum haliotis]MCT4697994.1 sensor histidine kinase [Tenacibaculum haliotis]
MNNFLKIYHSFLNVGVTSKKDNEYKKIRLLNAFCSTWCIMIIIITMFDLLFDREIKESLILHGISYVLIGVIFYCQKIKKYTLARVVFIASIIGITFVFANFTTPSLLIENFYFVYPLIGILFIEKKWINILFLLLCFCLYFIPNLFLNIYPKNMILPVLVFCVFLGTFVILNYSEALNKKKEEKLLESKIKLKKAYLKLEKQKENELNLLRLQTLKAQMNPHFMFNTMNSIQNLILKDDKIEAYDFFTKFSSLMRQNLKTSNDSFVELNTELSIVKNYLELEKLRFGDQFLFTIEELNFDGEIKIPSMIIQPYIEEAIRYRLLHVATGDKIITISFYLEKETLVCKILDNGIRNISQEQEMSSREILNKRLVLLKEYYKTDIGFSYETTKFGNKVLVKIPYTLLDE